MATEKDLLMFVTGVVGRAMGSGQFGVDNIEALAVNAERAFTEVFGDLTAEPNNSSGKTVSVQPSGWGDERLGAGLLKECTWREVYERYQVGDKAARDTLEWLANKYEPKPGKYEQEQRTRKERARSLLDKARAS